MRVRRSERETVKGLKKGDRVYTAWAEMGRGTIVTILYTGYEVDYDNPSRLRPELHGILAMSYDHVEPLSVLDRIAELD